MLSGSSAALPTNSLLTVIITGAVRTQATNRSLPRRDLEAALAEKTTRSRIGVVGWTHRTTPVPLGISLSKDPEPVELSP